MYLKISEEFCFKMLELERDAAATTTISTPEALFVIWLPSMHRSSERAYYESVILGNHSYNRRGSEWGYLTSENWKFTVRRQIEKIKFVILRIFALFYFSNFNSIKIFNYAISIMQ